MSSIIVMRAILISFGILLLGAGAVLLAQQAVQTPTPAPVPAPPCPPPYVAPDYRAVLGGTAPLRVLLVPRKRMLAWRGDGEVRAVNLATNAWLHVAKPAEMVGLVRVPETNSFSLRQNGQNFCPVPAALRLESDQPISLWSPDPDSWLTLAAPLIITPTADGTFSVARALPLEDYLRNVVPGEMPTRFHPQALRAQAVVARSYALCKLGRHADDGADVCATEHCQVFGKDDARAKETDEAVKATQGVTLLIGAKPAEPYYHATCGGATDDAGYLWGPEYARPYLTGVGDVAGKYEPDVDCAKVLAREDGFCKASNGYRWTRRFTAAEVDALVSKNLTKVSSDPTVQIRRVTKLTVEERTPAGRIASLRVEGDGASVLVPGDKVRWLFGTGVPGPDGLWSTLCTITPATGAGGVVTGYTITGGGRGHGIGLCQWGADGRARAGQSYREILHSYYPGTKLSDDKR